MTEYHHMWLSEAQDLGAKHIDVPWNEEVVMPEPGKIIGAGYWCPIGGESCLRVYYLPITPLTDEDIPAAVMEAERILRGDA